MSILDSKIPSGPLADKWTKHKNEIDLVNPANKRNIDVIIVGTGLAGASAAATLAELGYNVKTFCYQDSPRRAHSIAAQGGINAAKNYQGDGDSAYDWTAISEDLTSGGKQGNVAYGTLTSIDESKFQFGLLYTGSDDGKVFVSQNSGSDWQDISTTLPKDLWVSRVVASMHEKQRVYVTLNGYRWDDFTPYVYMSDNYGASWTNISNNLPLASVNVIREDPANPAILYLGTDNGAYTSFDNGASWNPFYEGLPNVAVHDLTIQARDKHLLLGTHGRSIYKADISLLQGISEKTMGSLMLADIASVRASRRWGSTGFNNYGAYFEPSVPLQIFAPLGGEAKISVTQESGNVLNSWEVTLTKGFNVVPYNASVSQKGKKQLEKEDISTFQGANGTFYLPKGSYIVEVSIGDFTINKTVEVK